MCEEREIFFSILSCLIEQTSIRLNTSDKFNLNTFQFFCKGDRIVQFFSAVITTIVRDVGKRIVVIIDERAPDNNDAQIDDCKSRLRP